MQHIIPYEGIEIPRKKKELLPPETLIYTKHKFTCEELSEKLGGKWAGPIRDRQGMWYGYQRVR